MIKLSLLVWSHPDPAFFQHDYRHILAFNHPQIFRALYIDRDAYRYKCPWVLGDFVWAELDRSLMIELSQLFWLLLESTYSTPSHTEHWNWRRQPFDQPLRGRCWFSEGYWSFNRLSRSRCSYVCLFNNLLWMLGIIGHFAGCQVGSFRNKQCPEQFPHIWAWAVHHQSDERQL